MVKMDSLEKKIRDRSVEYEHSYKVHRKAHSFAQMWEYNGRIKEAREVLEELGKVAQKIDVNGKAFIEVLEQEIEYFGSSGESDDLKLYHKKLGEIMGYVEHFIERQKGLLVESGTLETLEIMKDKKLMKLLRESRKKGSKSSPYKPLGEDSKERLKE